MSDWSNNRVVIRRKQPPDREVRPFLFAFGFQGFQSITQVNKQ